MGLNNFLKGGFLVEEGASKNWVFIVYCAFLALIMIYSSHKVEQKVYEINALSQRVKELSSEFKDGRFVLMQKKMRSNVEDALKDRGVVSSDTPPLKIELED